MRKKKVLAAAVESLELRRRLAMIAVTPDAEEIVPGNGAGSSRRLFGSASRVPLRGRFTAESLEDRVLLSYSSRVDGNTAVFEGHSLNASGDVLAFNTSGGLLAHNREADAGFNSAFDFDSNVAGDQTLAADAATSVFIRPGNGSDSIEFGSAFSTFNQPASKLLARFSIEHFADPSAGVLVVVDDLASAVANAFEVAPDHITATGINVEYTGPAAYSEISVTGGTAADTFNVTSSPNVLYFIDGRQPASAPGDVLNFDAQFIGATDNGSEITQTGRKPVQYQNIETVNVFNQTPDASQLVVKNTNNSGNNSLRYAILAANVIPGSNTITFDIPGSGVHVIAPLTDLPEITDTVVIDGYTQPGAKANTLAVGDNAVIKIELDGGGRAPDSGSTADFGLTISAPSSEVRGLSVVNFTTVGPSGGISIGYAIKVNTSNAIVAGNFVGVRADGTPAGFNDYGIQVFGRDNRIGGTAPADRNICSSSGVGIAPTPNGTGGPNLILGNYIGTDASGTQARLNATGILDFGGSRIGGSTTGAGNVISGNLLDGIVVTFGEDTAIRGNIIGLAADGVTPLGNQLSGVVVSGETTNVAIGGTLPGEGNIISANGGVGVFVRRRDVTGGNPNRGISIRGNSIFANGELGIDQSHESFADGVTPNEFNDGIVNFPVLTSAVAGGGLTVSGVINAAINTPVVIDVYASDTPDPSGYGEGQTYLGSIPVALGTQSNNAVFSETLAVTVAPGKFITATATDVSNDPNDDTSEFSKAVVVQGQSAPPPVTPTAPTIAIGDVTQNEGNSGTTSFTFTVTRTGDLTGGSSVAYTVADGTATMADNDYQSVANTLAFDPGQASKTITVLVNGDSKFESNETFNVNLSAPAGATLSDASAVGTIVNDDSLPTLSIGDVSQNEGNSGNSSFVFTVTRSGDLSSPVSVTYSTADGTAVDGTDYVAATDTIGFLAGQATQTFSVSVIGNTTVEADKTFLVNLSAPVGATLADAQAMGTIVNDDVPPPLPSNGKVSIVTDPCDSSKKALKIEGTDNKDTITVTKVGSSQGKASVKINGRNKGTFSFSGILLVYGKNGSDNISIDLSISRTAMIFAGEGNDTVSSGSGADAIAADGGNDNIKGNAGRDILFGGDGADKLDGGSGDDILVAGGTSQDDDPSTICKLLDEWKRTDKTYSQRRDHIINGGGLNGSVKLNASNIFSSPGLKDSLTGGSNTDLFFAAVPGDLITDKVSGETVVDVG